MAAFSIGALASEVQQDPAAIGYGSVVHADDCARVAAAINLTRAGGAFSVIAPSLAATAIQACLDPTEFATLSATQLSQLTVLLSGGVVNTSSPNVRAIALGIFSPSGSFPNTRAALTAVASRQGSRAEVLWGPGTVISAQQIAQAAGV
jgi:2-keto-3-deoxy-6-phosphogluconate aldolase